MKIRSIILLAMLVALVAMAGSACAKDAGTALSLSVGGMQTNAYIDGNQNLVAGPGHPVMTVSSVKPEINFTKLEEIGGLYVCVDRNGSDNSTIRGWFLLLSPPFYLNDNHELNAMYGTFSRDLTRNGSRPEYQSIYTGAWQWVADEKDQNKVMIRLGEWRRPWYFLWLFPVYYTVYREDVHISNVPLGGPYKMASLDVLGHHFEKIYV